MRYSKLFTDTRVESDHSSEVVCSKYYTPFTTSYIVENFKSLRSESKVNKNS